MVACHDNFFFVCFFRQKLLGLSGVDGLDTVFPVSFGMRCLS